jgi:16S rRNA (guanine1207-N2)-methyltransferase
LKPQFFTTPYTQVIRLKLRLGEETIEVGSKPGLPDWDRLSPATVLIGERIIFPKDARVLYLGCGNGAGAVAVARQLTSRQLWLCDINYLAIRMAAETISLNRIANAQMLSDINLPAELNNSFDAVIIDIPKGRKMAQRWLAQAFQALKTSGILYLCGATRQGINPLVNDAEILFGEPVVVGYKKGNRLVRFQKKQREWPANGWWQLQGIAPGTWHTLAIQTPSGSFEINSLPGIFSYDRLDEGTQLLLDFLPDLHNMNVLDLGCGYGAIGLTAARSGAASVDMVDANLLAVAAAKINIERLKLTNVRAIASDVLSAVADKKYHLILSNPPFHTGREVDYQVARAFIEQSYQALETGGRLYIVANRFIRYEKILDMHFQHASEVTQSPRYHVLCGEK